MMLRKGERFLFYLMPLAVVGVGFMNIIAYYINEHHSDAVRLVIVWGTLAILFIALCIKFMLIFIKAPKTIKKHILYYCIPPFVYVLVYCLGVLRSEIKEVILKQFVQNFSLFILLFLTIVCIVTENKVKEFINLFKWYNMLVLPIFIMYIVRLMFFSNAENEYYININLGKMSYMDISYFGLTLTLILCLDLIVNYDSRSRLKRIIIYLLLFVDAMVLWLSSTKGAFLCAFTLVAALIMYSFINKSYRIINLISSGLIILAYLLSVLISSLFQIPLQSRQDAFINEIMAPLAISQNEQQKPRTDEGPSKAEDDIHILNFPSFTLLEKENAIIRKVTGNDMANILEVGIYAQQIDYKEAYEDGLIDNEEYEILSSALYRLSRTSTGGRLTHWAFAIKEFLKSPIIGNGALHYANLGYGYPHNIILELASDFGVIGILLFLFAAIIVCIIIFTTWKNDIYVFCWVLPLIVFLPQKMVSSSLYAADMCLYGLAILFSSRILYKRIRSANKSPNAG